MVGARRLHPARRSDGRPRVSKNTRTSSLSLRKNVLASYASQIYVTLISIVMVPVYVRYMGIEAYGLIGFFVMVQAWFLLLDMGLTPTMSRETALYLGGGSSTMRVRNLLRTLELIFIGVGLLGALAIVGSANYIASGWLKVRELPLNEVQHAIMLMGILVALRWVSGLYRGAINGFERLVWLSAFNIAMATARFVLVIPFLVYVSARPTNFFLYQAAVALVEIVVLMSQTYRILPTVPRGGHAGWDWPSLRGVLKFSLSVAFTGSVWVFVTQSDKLLLSKLLPLTDYAYFTLAVLAASGGMVVSVPVSSALLPRLTRLSAVGDEAGLVRVYRNASQLVSVIAIPVALILALFAEPLLWVWTGDVGIAHKAAPVLALYALGNGVLALSAFPYYLQFAKGDLRLHLIGSALFAGLLLPALVWATRVYGINGAGYVWLSANSAYFLLWIPRVHARFAKGLHAQWLVKDVGLIVVVTVAAAFSLHELVPLPQERVRLVAAIALAGLATLIIAAAGSSWVRLAVSDRFAHGRPGRV
jgi:O-antigen/teichoic acid export membrane protein